MNLKEQLYVCVLAECGNITTASEKLYISQPALSMYISNLENTLGIKLFDRTGKKFIPTYAGELYIQKATEMLRLNKEFEDALDDLIHQNIGKLTIGIQLRRAPLLLPPVLARFRTVYPNVRVIVREGVQTLIEQMLLKDECTFYVYNLMEKRRELTSHLIFRDRMLLALPDGHPLLEHAVFTPGQPFPHLDLRLCLNETFIIPTANQSLRTHLNQIFEKDHIYPKQTMEIRNFETSMHMVAEGLGIGFNREQYAKSMYYPKPVVYCTFSDPDFCTTNLYISYPKDMELSVYAKYALELFIEEGRRLQKDPSALTFPKPAAATD